MLTLSGILLLVAVVMVIVGMFLWPTNHDYISGALMFLGLILGLCIAPWMVETYELSKLSNWLASLMLLIKGKGYIAWIGVGILLILDGFAALSRGYTVSARGVPVPAPSGTPAPIQWQEMFALMVPGVISLVLGVQGASAAYVESQLPQVAHEFIQFQDKVKNVDGVSIVMLPAMPEVKIVFKGTIIEDDEEEQEKWSKIVIDEFNVKEGKAKGETLIVEKVLSVIALSQDGKTIDEFVIQFNGNVDRPDPAPDKPIVGKGYPVPSNLDNDGTTTWLNKWTKKVLSVSTKPANSTAIKAAPKNTGNIIEPPEPGSFIDIE